MSGPWNRVQWAFDVMSCIHVRKGGRFSHVFIIFILQIFWPFSFMSSLFLPSLNRICTLYTLEEAKRSSLVKMSATDRNSLVPLDRDLEYTIEGASDFRTKYFC